MYIYICLLYFAGTELNNQIVKAVFIIYKYIYMYIHKLYYNIQYLKIFYRYYKV